MYVALKIPYVYDYINKLCRTQAEVILNHVNPTVRDTGQEETMHREYTRLKLRGDQAYDRSAD
jgi:predicted secreted Zn-dependent protease